MNQFMAKRFITHRLHTHHSNQLVPTHHNSVSILNKRYLEIQVKFQNVLKTKFIICLKESYMNLLDFHCWLTEFLLWRFQASISTQIFSGK